MPESATQPPSDLSLDDLLSLLRRRWGGALLAFLAGAILTLGLAALLHPHFTSTGSVYLVDNPGTSGDPSNFLANLAPQLGLTGANVESHKDLLRSTDLALKVIGRLGLNAELKGPPELLPARPIAGRWWLAQKVQPYRPGLRVGLVEGTFLVPRTLAVVFQDGQHFSVADPAAPDAPVPGMLDRPVKLADGSFVLRALELGRPIPAGSALTLTLTPASLVLDDFAKALDVSGSARIAGRGSNVIDISFTAGSPYLAQEVVGTLIDEFLLQKRSWATESGRAALDFINGQLTEMHTNLEKSAADLAAYQAGSGMLALEPQLDAALKRLVDSEVLLQQSEMKLAALDKLVQHLDQPDVATYLYSFLDDPVMQKLGGDLADQSRQIALLEAQFSPQYPPLRDLLEARGKLQGELKQTLQRYAERLRRDRDDMARVVADYSTKFKAVPEAARMLEEFKRATQHYADVYDFLFKQQASTQYALAGTPPDIRTIDHPFVPLQASFPKMGLAVALAVVIGLLSAFGVLFLEASLTTRFSEADQVQAAFTQPVFAIVPGRRRRPARASPQTLDQDLQGPFLESIRQLRVNLLHSMAGRKHQAVLVTSSMAGEGKTTIAANLAVTLARSERVESVLLVDADMHKPSLAEVFARPASPGLSDFLNGQATLQDIIQTVPLPDGRPLHLVCAGPTPPSPGELVEAPGMAEFLEYAAGHYTFSVFDAPPYPMVSTALVLAGRFDRILSVCRLRRTYRRAFRRHVEEFAAVNKQLGLVVNAAGARSGYAYAYGYGYRAGAPARRRWFGWLRRRAGRGQS